MFSHTSYIMHRHRAIFWCCSVSFNVFKLGGGLKYGRQKNPQMCPNLLYIMVQMVTAIVFLHDSVSMFVKTFQCPEMNESAPLPSRSNHLKRRPCISLVGLRKTQRLQKRSFILIKYTLAAGQGCRRDSDLNCTASEINLMASGVYVSFCVGCVRVCGCCVCVYVFHWRIVMTSFISEVDLTAFISV